MKSVFRLYLEILAEMLLVFAIVLVLGLGLLQVMFHEHATGWPAAQMACAVAAVISFLIVFPLLCAVILRDKRKLEIEREQLSVDLKEAKHSSFRALQYIRTFGDGHTIRDVLLTAAERYRAALEIAADAVSGKPTFPMRPLDSVDSVNQSLQESRRLAIRAEGELVKFRHLQDLAQEHVIGPVPMLQELLAEIKNPTKTLRAFLDEIRNPVCEGRNEPPGQ